MDQDSKGMAKSLEREIVATCKRLGVMTHNIRIKFEIDDIGENWYAECWLGNKIATMSYAVDPITALRELPHPKDGKIGS